MASSRRSSSPSRKWRPSPRSKALAPNGLRPSSRPRGSTSRSGVRRRRLRRSRGRRRARRRVWSRRPARPIRPRRKGADEPSRRDAHLCRMRRAGAAGGPAALHGRAGGPAAGRRPPRAGARRVPSPCTGLLGCICAPPRSCPFPPPDARSSRAGTPARAAGRGSGDLEVTRMPKRIHELAKEWGVAPKDMLARAEKLGIRGKRSQSSLTDEEAERLKEDLGLAPRPTVPLGTERVVSERVVTERDSGADQLVTAREQTTETRLRANVIRRRTAREVLKREELPPAPPEGDGASEVPPSLDFEAEVPPPAPQVIAEPAAEGAPRAEEPPAREPEETESVEAARAQRVAEAPPAAVRPAMRPATPALPAPGRPTAPAAPPPPGFEEMRGVKVLGKIDLRKAAPPGAAPP